MANTVELFTLRLWQEAAGGKHEWRGKIQHIRSGQARYFRDWNTLVDFLTETAPHTQGPGSGPGQSPGGGSAGATQRAGAAKSRQGTTNGKRKQQHARSLFRRVRQAQRGLAEKLVQLDRAWNKPSLASVITAVCAVDRWTADAVAVLFMSLTPTVPAFAFVDL